MEWVEFYSLEPWGDTMADLRNGRLCALLANCHRDSEKTPEPFIMEDFMFTSTMKQNPEPERRLTPEETEKHLSNVLGA